ncbi:MULTISPECIES: hypothetical protein [unclassified Acinetobacter]|uniref:hypothetical protein n=1 Tax=unclassified Acinetobacter TaxID=196816 RepID=UPI002934EED6|nr:MULTISPECIES: hypothetical protein [unclassified Acinetobacter]WOE32098.1 hypothetical protein QSG84_02475 [Acinetobacter sp. SAAs470]WOE37567.1 hypothetical protein QSG86_11520 [Acinetobacter sp. SAAs474]
MKKLWLLLGFLFSNQAFSADLQCLKSFETFKNIQDEGINAVINGTNDDIKAFGDQYDYSGLFKKNHAGKSYWIDEDVAKTSLLIMASSFKNGEAEIVNYTFSEPKANFISSIGEVCVVPMQSTSTYLEDEMTTNADVIFIRDLNSNQWRLFTYYGSEKKEDFNEFFPDFPKSVKLSASSTTYKSGNNLTSIDYAKILYKKMAMDIPPEVLHDLQKKQEETTLRKKMNGFN